LLSISVGFSISDIRIIIKKRELPLDPEGKKCYGYVRGYACLARLNGPDAFKKNTPFARETKNGPLSEIPSPGDPVHGHRCP
jgi:hypothetical protein